MGPSDADNEVPDFSGVRDTLISELVRFVRVLRYEEVTVPANAAITGAQALIEVGFDDEETGKAALRATFVSRPEDLPTFDRLFPRFWKRLRETLAGTRRSFEPESGDEAEEDGVVSLARMNRQLNEDTEVNRDREEPLEFASGEQGEGEDRPGESTPDEKAPGGRQELAEDDGDEPDPEEEGAESAIYSPAGQSTMVDVDEAAILNRRDGLAAAIDRLGAAIAGLRGRRWSRSGAGHVDTRQALRRSFGTGGTVLDVPERERKRSAVRAVLLVDVSRSVLDTIDRGFLLRFLWQVHSRWRSVRVFFFDTSIREVTDQFDAPTIDDAVSALEQAEAAWGGGTRIGHAIETIQQRHPDTIDRDTVVFVLSDGLEVGELDLLEREMAWLSQRAGAVFWLNPLATSTEYEPTCQGMDVSIQYVDGLFGFTEADDIDEIARQLHRHGLFGNIGYEHDPRRVGQSEAAESEG